MTDSEFPHAPGCFASALTYKPAAPECQTCAFAAACGPRSEKKLAELRVKFGIVAPDKKTVSDKGFTVPVKTAALLARIARLGVNVADALADGINPFVGKGPAFMALTCHLLIRLPGLTRRELEESLEKKLGWTRETAISHTLQAVQALVAMGAADEIEGRIIRRTNND